jgi:hypothetical protein
MCHHEILYMCVMKISMCKCEDCTVVGAGTATLHRQLKADVFVVDCM